MRRLAAGILLALLCLPAPPAVAENPPSFAARWGTHGTGVGRFDLPMHIAADGRGNVYVTDYRNCRIQRFTEAGDYITSWLMPGLWQGDYFSRYGPMGVAVGPDGSVYVSTSEALIRRYTPDGTPIVNFGTFGFGEGQIYQPHGLACDSWGNVYVADAGLDRIAKYSSDGSWLGMWGTSGSGDGQFNGPREVAVNVAGEVVVSDATGRVQFFTADGAFLRSWRAVAPNGGGIWGIAGIGVDASGNVYAADADANQVHKFTADGTPLSSWGQYGVWASGDFNRPMDVDVDAAGAIYVTDGNNDRVQKFVPCAVNCGEISRPCAESPKLVLHVHAATADSACASGRILSCADVITEGDVSEAPVGYRYFVYLLVHVDRARSIAGLQCGITYQDGAPSAIDDQVGVDILDWRLCATMEFPTPGDHAWPRPGGGNMITWMQSDCQAEATGVAGYFYVSAYSEDQLRLTVRPVDGAAKVANCEGAEIRLTEADLGYVSFSRGARLLGCNPARGEDCTATVPVEKTTWSTIKTLYAR